MKTSALRILVAGSVASASGQAGAASAVLQYLLGLRTLGHEVWFVDQLSRTTKAADGKTSAADVAGCLNLMAGFEFADCFTILQASGGPSSPIPRARLREVAAGADVLLNLSGRLTDADIYERIPVRVFLDLDPGFNQIWSQSGIDLNLESHTHFATLGSALGRDTCRVPLLGRRWINFHPPVSLPEWPVENDPPVRGFTTVANWRSYGTLWDADVRLGLKAHSFRKLLDLPRVTDIPLEIALDIEVGDKGDLAALKGAGWAITEGRSVTSTVSSYASFVRSSMGEIAVAKEGYVSTRSGWFSERSAAYLASGRPVVAQSTGFEHYLPVGGGVIPFADSGQAAAAMEAIRGRYRWHSSQARDLAEEYFAAERVLSRLLDEVYATRAASS